MYALVKIYKRHLLKPVLGLARCVVCYSATHENHFPALAQHWWANFESEPLYLMNQLRIPFIRDGLIKQDLITIDSKKAYPLEGISLLDIGCGVGFLTESLARLGATMTSIDPEEENIKHARLHLQDAPFSDKIHYKCGYSEDMLIEYSDSFDAVIASEVIEHVENPEKFVNTAVSLTKKNGSLFFTTVNRTWWSYLSTIFMAEKVLRIITPGMHDWKMFITPEELSAWLENNNCRVTAIKGMKYNPLTKTFSWCSDKSDNYALSAVKLT